MDRLKEECGIFGMYNNKDAVNKDFIDNQVSYLSAKS
tara:strand:- start:12 stop:122 length:111 start_codon:yes stop_codon:yes gene_type:complete